MKKKTHRPSVTFVWSSRCTLVPPPLGLQQNINELDSSANKTSIKTTVGISSEATRRAAARPGRLATGPVIPLIVHPVFRQQEGHPASEHQSTTQRSHVIIRRYSLPITNRKKLLWLTRYFWNMIRVIIFSCQNKTNKWSWTLKCSKIECVTYSIFAFWLWISLLIIKFIIYIQPWNITIEVYTHLFKSTQLK